MVDGLAGVELVLRKISPAEKKTTLHDEVLFYNKGEGIIVTKWIPHRKREDDLASGISIWLLKRGWKLNIFFNENGQLTKWHCDVGRFLYKCKEEKLVRIIFEDLILDFIIYSDGSYKVEDEEQYQEALKQKILSDDQMVYPPIALRNLKEAFEKGELVPAVCMDYLLPGSMPWLKKQKVA